MNNSFTIRKAERKDVGLLLEFIRGIAKYKKMEDEVVAMALRPIQSDILPFTPWVIRCSRRYRIVTSVYLSGIRQAHVKVKLYSQNATTKILTMVACIPSRSIIAKNLSQKKVGNIQRWN